MPPPQLKAISVLILILVIVPNEQSQSQSMSILMLFFFDVWFDEVVYLHQKTTTFLPRSIKQFGALSRITRDASYANFP